MYLLHGTQNLGSFGAGVIGIWRTLLGTGIYEPDLLICAAPGFNYWSDCPVPGLHFLM